MKIRTSFVSNSSSSSFVCQISGDVTSGRDGEYEDFYPMECLCGHAFAPNFVRKLDKNLTTDEKKEFLTSEELSRYFCDYGDELDDAAINRIFDNSIGSLNDALSDSWGEYRFYELPSTCCPICHFEKIAINDRIRFLVKELLGDKGTLEAVDKEIFSRFSSYKEFAKYVEKVEL